MALEQVRLSLINKDLSVRTEKVTFTELINWIELVRKGKTFYECNKLVGVSISNFYSEGCPRRLLRKLCKHRELYFRYYTALESCLEVGVKRLGKLSVKPYKSITKKDKVNKRVITKHIHMLRRELMILDKYIPIH